MSTTVRSAFAAAIGVLCATGLLAQSSEEHGKTKVEVEGGKHVAVTGCLERGSGAATYVVTTRTGELQYALVTNDDLSKYLDRRVEVKGRAGDTRDAKVKIERKVEGTTGERSESKVETKGDTSDLPFLRVQSIKRVGGSCR